MNLAIETNNLEKRYGEVLAVDHLSLKVKEGEIYAFLGLNGAGKTTTIRMLLGMIRPTDGSAKIWGKQVLLGSREPWAEIGYLVETPHAYPDLTVIENLEVARRLHPGTPPSAVCKTIERLGLSEYANRRAGNLSLGNAQRLGLAKALLHNPRLLLLDEPANGLDPAGIVEIRQLLLDLTREEGITVFMSSHILAEVSRLAQRIGIIHQGHLIQELSRDELEQNRRQRLLVGARDLRTASRVLSNAGYSSSFTNEGMLEIMDPRTIAGSDQLACALVQAGTPPTQMVIEDEDLENYFLRLVGENGGNHNG